MLNRRLYYANNPIVLDIPLIEDVEYVLIKVDNINSGKSLSAKLYTHSQLSLHYDVSEMISALFESLEAEFDTDIPNVIRNQIIDVSIVISRYTPPSVSQIANIFERIKVLRGGEFSTDVNIGFDSDFPLILTEKLAVWDGYPPVFYTTRNLMTINSVRIPTEYQTLPVKSCDSIYIAFQNIKGGYSAWLFSDYSVKSKTKETEKYNAGYDLGRRKEIIKTTGSDIDFTIELFDRVDKYFYPYLFSLQTSSDIWIYNLENPSTGEKSGKWEKLINLGQSSNIKTEEQTTDFTINLGYISSLKLSKTW